MDQAIAAQPSGRGNGVRAVGVPRQRQRQRRARRRTATAKGQVQKLLMVQVQFQTMQLSWRSLSVEIAVGKDLATPPTQCRISIRHHLPASLCIRPKRPARPLAGGALVLGRPPPRAASTSRAAAPPRGPRPPPSPGRADAFECSSRRFRRPCFGGAAPTAACCVGRTPPTPAVLLFVPLDAGRRCASSGLSPSSCVPSRRRRGAPRRRSPPRSPAVVVPPAWSRVGAARPVPRFAFGVPSPSPSLLPHTGGHHAPWRRRLCRRRPPAPHRRAVGGGPPPRRRPPAADHAAAATGGRPAAGAGARQPGRTPHTVCTARRPSTSSCCTGGHALGVSHWSPAASPATVQRTPPRHTSPDRRSATTAAAAAAADRTPPTRPAHRGSQSLAATTPVGARRRASQSPHVPRAGA